MKSVSAIMPTRGRQELAQRALEAYYSQTYTMKELIVLDDAGDPSFPAGIQRANVSYHRMDAQLSIPEKRNLCCEMAVGDIIMHFDSDDWSAPGRMEDQVRRLAQFDVAMTGYHSMLFYNEFDGKAYRYEGARIYAIGTSFAYLKGFWRRHRFPKQYPLGSDNQVVYAARGSMALATEDAKQFMVARIHEGNSNFKDCKGSNFKAVKPESLPEPFLRCLTSTP